jgi:predicted RNA-binding Zn-ribbon protein involved in translation (DUF1610 family)
MFIDFDCPNCHQTITIEDEGVTTKFKCPICRKFFTI